MSRFGIELEAGGGAAGIQRLVFDATMAAIEMTLPMAETVADSMTDSSFKVLTGAATDDAGPRSLPHRTLL